MVPLPYPNPPLPSAPNPSRTEPEQPPPPDRCQVRSRSAILRVGRRRVRRPADAQPATKKPGTNVAGWHRALGARTRPQLRRGATRTRPCPRVPLAERARAHAQDGAAPALRSPESKAGVGPRGAPPRGAGDLPQIPAKKSVGPRGAPPRGAGICLRSPRKKRGAPPRRSTSRPSLGRAASRVRPYAAHLTRSASQRTRRPPWPAGPGA